MDPNFLIENLDGWVLNCLEDELSRDEAWKKLASVVQIENKKSLFSVNEICQMKASDSPATTIIQRLVKFGITLEGLLQLLSVAQLDNLHALLAPKERVSITKQPSPRLSEVPLGSSVVFSVEVKGNPPPSFVWYKGEQPLLHQNTKSLNIQNFGVQEEGLYLCLVRQKNCQTDSDDTHDCIDEWSDPVEVYIKPTPPLFTRQPQGGSVNYGNQISFEVECSKAYPPPEYSWYRDNFLITVTPKSTLIISNADPSNSGDYVCVAHNEAGVCKSQPAKVNVLSEKSVSIAIIREPSIAIDSVSRGVPIQLWCSARCSLEVTFQWYKSGHIIEQSATSVIMHSSTSDVHSSSLMYVPTETDPSTLRFLCIVSSETSKVSSKEACVSVTASHNEAVTYSANRKFALLVGNSKYKGKSLNTTISDCLQLKTKLESLGFKCLLLADMTLSFFLKAVEFFKSFIGQGDYVMFYYGGHGYHEGGDKIIPVDAVVNEEGVEGGPDASCLSPVFIRNTLLQCQPSLLFIVLDMCRTTLPVVSSPAAVVLLPHASRCSVVLHATSIHCAALEAQSSTSVLMRHLLRRIESGSSLPLSAMVSLVLQDVCGESHRVRQQQYPVIEADLALPRTLSDAPTAAKGAADMKWEQYLGLGGEVATAVSVGASTVTVTASCQYFGKAVHNILLLTANLLTDDLKVKATYDISAVGCRVSSIKSEDPKRRSVFKIENLQCLSAPLMVRAKVDMDGRIFEAILNLQYPGIAKTSLQTNNLETNSVHPKHHYSNLNITQ